MARRQRRDLSVFESSCHLPTCLPHTVKASRCSFNCWTSSREAVNSNFYWTRPGIEPESTASVADALSTRPLIGEWTTHHWFLFCMENLTDENESLSRWREYLDDLLNPVSLSTRDTHEVIHLGEEEVFTAAEVAAAIKGIKSGKAAGEDEIGPRCWKRWMEKKFSGQRECVKLRGSLAKLSQIGKQVWLFQLLRMKIASRDGHFRIVGSSRIIPNT